ncbi:hypothetical protein ACFQH5_15170 [Halomonas salifodinae]|uniref:Uncharacterized protein n=1 Tax=Halomonas salifodinae TaxID=438745 RepID=A0ABW2F1J9_9GAMM
MTVSIWHLVNILASEDISLMLAGADPEDFKTRKNYPDDHFQKQGDFHRVMIHAAQNGELQPCGIEVADRDEHGEVIRDLKTGIFGWHTLPDEDDRWKGYPIDLVRFYVDRREIYRWLTARGFSKSDMPEALRIQPERKEDVSLSSVKLDDVKEKKHTLKRDVQDGAILAKLREMGYEPTELPKRESGKRGHRAAVRDEFLPCRRDLFTPKSFEKSWERLRGDGRIREK